jgi:hypothetical protein
VFGILAYADTGAGEPFVEPAVDGGQAETNAMLFPEFFADLLPAPPVLVPDVYQLLDDMLGCPGLGLALLACFLTPDELRDTQPLDFLEPAVDCSPVPLHHCCYLFHG